MITEGTQQVLTVLYPLYKDEVYKRREQMIKLTAFGAFGLIVMLFVLLLSPVKNRLTSPESLLLGLASLTWCGIFCGLILQQQYRHRLAKQAIGSARRTAARRSATSMECWSATGPTAR